MNIVPINTQSKEFKRAWQIYEEAFPADERRTREQQESLMKNERRYQYNAISEGTKVIGMIAFWDFPEMYFIEHMAMAQEERGQGKGTKVLEQYREGKKKPIILEVERPESSEVAKKRIVFWERAGFKLNETHNYIQPAYGPGKAPVPMRIMSTPKKITAKQFGAMRLQLHTQVYKLPTPLV